MREQYKYQDTYFGFKRFSNNLQSTIIERSFCILAK